jgi:exosortase family protein XrtF
MNWQEFRPTIFFLLKFLGFYLVGNLIYGFYVTAYSPAPDPVTQEVTEQTSMILRGLGWPNETMIHPSKATVWVRYQHRAIISVYEGCNGLNVVIIFIGFLFAFGPIKKKLLWFVPLGILLIHAANLARVSLLFLVSLKLPDYLYFSHKYLFTASIYAMVLVLWVAWVKYFSIQKA